MQIGYLTDHPHFLPILAQWHHQQWGDLRPGDSADARADRIRKSCGRRQVPTTLIAFKDTTLLGSAMLVEKDLDTGMDLSPWLVGVFVAPDQRGKGIGAALVRRMIEEANALGIARLYLVTADRQHFYAGLGWSHLQKGRYREVDVAVMFFDCPVSIESNH